MVQSIMLNFVTHENIKAISKLNMTIQIKARSFLLSSTQMIQEDSVPCVKKVSKYMMFATLEHLWLLLTPERASNLRLTSFKARQEFLGALNGPTIGRT
jgi:hypothetical protein